jgi:c(7)-type cytochrome triheme protein
MGNPAAQTNFAKAFLVTAGVIAFAASCLQQSPKLAVTLTSAEPAEPVAVSLSEKKFEAFSHKIKEHQQFQCTTCHQREGRSLDMDYAGHESCVGCHLNQFVDKELMDKSKTMCAICHAAKIPDMNKFPTRFKEGWNMKFDHADHDNGAGRPPEGCASCHRSSGPGKTILSGFDSHANCYTCHTADSKIGSSCSTCHELAPYNRTLQSEYNFRYIFRHDDHGPAQGVRCDECHKITAGAPTGRQVSNIAIRQHLTPPGSNCAQCHNGRRAFTGNNPFNVASCALCHKDRVIKLPAGTVQEAAPKEDPQPIIAPDPN